MAEYTTTNTRAGMTIRILPNAGGSPAGKLADAELTETDRHNQQVEAAELRRWATAPTTTVAYYRFPLASAHFGQRAPFDLLCGRYTEDRADVTTWLGTRIGDVLSARVYRHNFGGRFVALRVRGTNGAEYVGRASYDNGNAIILRKVQGGTR